MSETKIATDPTNPDSEQPLDVEEIACALARLADEKMAEDIVLLDVREISTVTEFLLICTGTSSPHLNAIRRHLSEEGALLPGAQRNCIDGNLESHWLVIDFWQVMIHVFHPEKRAEYTLEDLWGDARRVDWQEA